MREIKKRNPERYCVLEYDKLFVEHRVYVWNEVVGQVSNSIGMTRPSLNAESQVVEMNDSERSLDPVTRAGTAEEGCRGGGGGEGGGRGGGGGLQNKWGANP